MNDLFKADPERILELGQKFSAANTSIDSTSGDREIDNVIASLSTSACAQACADGVIRAGGMMSTIADHWRVLGEGAIASSKAYTELDADYGQRISEITKELW
ncbi:hypothetical protein AB0H76_15755 [Nocardia sp. NPDC050712]|uniref:hypothetical protein n=1 Tax=Nocardia sp. NPDC050712 TaxID=3155518 RepID=UPI003411116A